MSSIKHAVILAAGLGSRLGLGIPKILLKIHEKTILEYQLKALEDIEHLWIVVGNQLEKVIEQAKSIRNDIIFVHNKNFTDGKVFNSFYLGTKLLNVPHFVIDGDIIFTKQAFLNATKYFSSNSEKLGIVIKKLDHIYSNDDNPVYAHIEEEKIVDLSFQKKSLFEYAGILYNNGEIKANKDKNFHYIFEFLTDHLPISYYQIEHLVEIDTQENILKAETHLLENKNLYM